MTFYIPDDYVEDHGVSSGITAKLSFADSPFLRLALVIRDQGDTCELFRL